MSKWYRCTLKEQVQPLIKKWQTIMGLDKVDFQIRKMKTKWGTCLKDEQRIWINLDLIKKPPHCLEYVIVHELTHFLEPSHNDRFIAYMDKFLPNWRCYKKELNEFELDYAVWDKNKV